MTDKEALRIIVKPPTLGKMQVLSKYYLALDIDDEKLGRSPHTESMRVCESKTDVVCRLMAVSTMDERDDLLDDEKVQELADFFKRHCKPSDFSTVILAIFTQVQLLPNESVVWGNYIAPVIEKFHWTFDYVMWGISFTNLQMLLADAHVKIENVHVLDNAPQGA